jgi:hypothetical protein
VKISHQPLSLESLDTLAEVDTVCVFVAEDERPLQGLAGYLDWRLCGGISRLLLSGFLQGTLGESLLLPTQGRVAPQRAFVLGVGKRGALEPPQLADLLARAGDVLAKARATSVALEVPGGPKVDEAARIAALEQDLLLLFQGERVVVLADRQVNAAHPKPNERQIR